MLMRSIIPRCLVLSKSLIAHALCLARPDFKVRLGHFIFAHTGKVFFTRALMDFTNTDTGLLLLGPLQAHLGSGVDMQGK